MSKYTENTEKTEANENLDELLSEIHKMYGEFRLKLGFACVKHGEDPFITLYSTLAGSLEYEIKTAEEEGFMSKEDANDLRMRLAMSLIDSMNSED